MDFGHQFVATIGLSLVSMAEDIGTEMSLRMMDHLMQYSEIYVRRAVPIALGMQYVSNPELAVTETLSKLSHDSDADVAMSAMLALGLVGAGTNNSRVAGMLRGLASYYAREPNHLFVLRISQGFLHMGKGLIGFAPYHGERSLMSPVAVSGLLVFLHSCADLKNLLLGKWHWLLFFLACSMYPRMLVTVDADMQPVPCSVRVGKAVDTVGQVPNPRRPDASPKPSHRMQTLTPRARRRPASRRPSPASRRTPHRCDALPFARWRCLAAASLAERRVGPAGAAVARRAGGARDGRVPRRHLTPRRCAPPKPPWPPTPSPLLATRSGRAGR